MTDAVVNDLVPVEASPLAMIQRLVLDGKASPDVVQQLINMSLQLKAAAARDAFNVAMADAQKEMRPVAADASNPQTRSRYASYGALDRAVRPIYTAHGFGLSFDTGDAPLAEYVRVLCYVTHAAGFERTYHVDLPADGKGAKGGDVMTKTHAYGSGLSYGMRYLLKMVFNIAVGEDDDDGNAAGRPGPATDTPEGFEAWLAALTEIAEHGTDELSHAWAKSSKPHKAHMTLGAWERLKTRAAQVSKVAK
jgi:hypothetical protein